MAPKVEFNWQGIKNPKISARATGITNKTVIVLFGMFFLAVVAVAAIGFVFSWLVFG